MNNLRFLLISCVLLLFSCKGNFSAKENAGEMGMNVTFVADIPKVKVIKAKEEDFQYELFCNGKVFASKKVAVAFKVSDIITEIRKNNGDWISKGEVIAVVDNTKLKQTLALQEEAMTKAELELMNLLYSEGLKTIDDTIHLPEKRFFYMKMQSNLTRSKRDLEIARQELRDAEVRAPFSGIIADMEAKQYNLSSLGGSVCTILDDSDMDIEFSVLETELKNIKKGSEVEIIPYSNPELHVYGIIKHINPRIDNNGMLKVMASANNKDRLLMDGMNVNIVVRETLTQAIQVPRLAILPRQGRKVVFIHNNGKAEWKYVTTGLENNELVCIETGIKEGDEVIYDNNLSLSHDSRVNVIPNE
ncbi:MAG: efflux RND transporter periplasmic adaptor subunit [Marinifilaceae bacterium]